ncbi:MAG: DUF4266 domain-containing protein [Candidatus Zixiibacteriota bacterium]
MRYLKLFTGLMALIAVSILLSSCGAAGVRVQVWERDILAKPEMQLDSPALDMAIDDHIYFSKEAASGGRSFGGGGCGCN